jgi:hypothetical protein
MTMKKIKQTFTLLLLLCGMGYKTVSQDIIGKLDKSKIEAQIVEISATIIKYRKFQNLDGPLYSINVSEIAYIQFKNGMVEYYAGKKTETVVSQKPEVLSFEEGEIVVPKKNKIPAYKPAPPQANG